MRTRRRESVALLSIAFLGLTSCAVGDGPDVVGVDEDAPTAPGHIGRGVRAEISVGPVYNGGLQDLTVRLSHDVYRLSSYQGSIRFSPSVASLKGYRLPQSDFHVVNDLEASTGRARFAGYAVDGFGGPQALIFTFGTQRPLSAGDLVVHFDVLGSAEGVSAHSSQLSLVGNMVAGGGR